MRQDKHSILWQPDDHPSLEQLRQYQEDLLPPAVQHQLERHLLDCDLCTDVLEGMAVTEPSKTAATVQRINKRIAARAQKKKRKPLPLYLTDWRVAAAILLVLCSTLLVFYYNYTELSKNDRGIAVSDTSTPPLEEPITPGAAPAAAESMESIAELKPDTVRPKTIAAVRGSVSKTPPVSQLAEEAAVSATPQTEPVDVTIQLADAPVIASAPAAAAPLRPEVAKAKTLLVPETTTVAKALSGSVAGVQLKGSAPLSPKQLQGQVLSPEGQPLPGVAVTIKGTTNGAVTDAKGNFTLSLPQEKATLAFSYIGYQREEKAVDANTQELTVNLKEDTRSLSEVVVTGYGARASQAREVISAKPVATRQSYKKYLEENIRYTSAMQKGRVVIQATVSSNGALRNLKVLKSLCTACDAEALRLVKEGPAWKPATSNGEPVEQQVKITVRFRPEGN